MTIDPRTPVIIGVAQLSQKPAIDDQLINAPDPIDLMTEAIRQAAADAAGADVAADLINTIDTIAVIGGLWRFKNPAALIIDELNRTGELRNREVHTILTTFGGNLPIHSAHTLAQRIADGDIDLAVLTGGECNFSRRNLTKRDEQPRRRDDIRAEPAENWGPPLDMGDLVAVDRGGETPRNSYAILDSAIRAERGETLDEARDRAAQLWSGYAAVGSRNPHAADPSGLSAEAIRNPTNTNRMVSWPYTKAMCANNNVDQAAALIIASTETADRLGVPASQRVYPHLYVASYDTDSLLERETVTQAPGLAAAAAALRAQVGPLDEIGHLELYSCFPSIVTLTTEALGINPERQLTVTGGLAFAGAPLNFAAGQGLVGMVRTLRADPGSRGFVQGNGGHASKHAFGVYSTTSPTEPHQLVELGQFGELMPLAPADHVGEGRVEGVTVEYGHGGPTRAIAIVSYDNGQRSWATSTNSDLMQDCISRECVGRRVMVDAGAMRWLDADG
ncbi:MAG: acetyl-CoA C-acetyltransferase [Candidatus Aldehydirespiratoraceae bacterium]